MQSLGIIEDVKDITDWCAPMVLMIKQNKKIQNLCGLNKAQQKLWNGRDLFYLRWRTLHQNSHNRFLHCGFWQIPQTQDHIHYGTHTILTRPNQHPATHWMHNLLCTKYWWPNMRSDIHKYVASCPSCAQVKISWTFPTGKLMQLPMPQCPCSHIALEFVTISPNSSATWLFWSSWTDSQAPCTQSHYQHFPLLLRQQSSCSIMCSSIITFRRTSSATRGLSSRPGYGPVSWRNWGFQWVSLLATILSPTDR